MKVAPLSLLLGALALSLAGCPEETNDGTTTSSSTTSSSSGTSCELAYLGDAAKDIEVELFFYGADEADHAITDGTTVDLILPPQGGRVVFVGVRATNLDPCAATLTGAMRDPTTNQIRFDTRTINLAPTGDGYGVSAPGDLSSYANVPLCHNTWLPTDIYGSDFKLEVTLADRDGKTITKTTTVRPECSEPEADILAECRCICQGGYILGQPCDGAGGGGGAGGSG
jgi:hypothetical protein